MPQLTLLFDTQLWRALWQSAIGMNATRRSTIRTCFKGVQQPQVASVAVLNHHHTLVVYLLRNHLNQCLHVGIHLQGLPARRVYDLGGLRVAKVLEQQLNGVQGTKQSCSLVNVLLLIVVVTARGYNRTGDPHRVGIL